jgi:hypothetical protein
VLDGRGTNEALVHAINLCPLTVSLRFSPRLASPLQVPLKMYLTWMLVSRRLSPGESARQEAEAKTKQQEAEERGRPG